LGIAVATIVCKHPQKKRARQKIEVLSMEIGGIKNRKKKKKKRKKGERKAGRVVTDLI